MIDEKYLDDVKLLWKDQIAGIIDYDYSNFLGALSDLQTDPNWKHAFKEIETDPGVLEFLERLQKHFDLCNSPLNEDGSIYAYQHPIRAKQQEASKNKSEIIALTKRHLDSITEIAKEFGEEDAERIANLKVVWTSDLTAIDDDPYARDGVPADISLYETQGNIHDKIASIENAPQILEQLREACYGLAADYELQRYLMQSFYENANDVDSVYKLKWLHGCDFYFDETTCYVYDSSAYYAYMKAAQEAEE